MQDTPKKLIYKDGKVSHIEEYLGKVVNKEIGLFRNRKRGLFTFNLEHGYGEPNPLLIPEVYEIPKNLILNFGDVWLVDQILKKTGLDVVIDNLLPDYADTFKTLVAFRLTDSHAYCHAEDWYRVSYARVQYPSAKVESSQISKFHEFIGQ
ncbi:MAG: hypothetical protein LBG48_05615 [Rickettsiales bacterium]|nr:hypothetical protein [Rickettsiales bacterium]